ncbi:MAG TPA: Hsp20/alpha crystallin family protein [Verrucomicrobia bacterium]|nr:Hsp20/alpha crystallin family protein [Verrucomicrobiota bacterium]
MYWPETTWMRMDPFTGIRQLQHEINRLFNGSSFGEESDVFPAVNLWSHDEQVILTAHVPGVDPKDIEINVQGDQLVLQGERKEDELSKDVVCRREERSFGKFSRSFDLPYEIDSSKVMAKCMKGVLTVVLERTEASKPRKIAIAAE